MLGFGLPAAESRRADQGRHRWAERRGRRGAGGDQGGTLGRPTATINQLSEPARHRAGDLPMSEGPVKRRRFQFLELAIALAFGAIVLLTTLWLLPPQVAMTATPLNIQEQLLLGSWRLIDPSESGSNVVLEFRPDRSMLERRPASSESETTGHGRWRLKGSTLIIENEGRMRIPEILARVIGADQRPDGATTIQIQDGRLQLGSAPSAMVFARISKNPISD